MKLVVGLGNPGAAYLMTRHNIGFMSADILAGSEAFVLKKNCKSLVVRKQISILRPKSETKQNKPDRRALVQKQEPILNPKSETEREQKKTGLRALFQKRKSDSSKNADPSKEIRFLIAKPQTYMNRSGEATAALLAFYKIPLHNLLVIQDDVDQEFMKLKFQKNRGAGGHKGIQNIHDCLKTADYARLKLGVGRPSRPQAEILKGPAQKKEESEAARQTQGAGADPVWASRARNTAGAGLAQNTAGAGLAQNTAGAGRAHNTATISVSDYVLSPFSEQETSFLKEFSGRAAEAVFCFIEHGFEIAAGNFNRRL